MNGSSVGTNNTSGDGACECTVWSLNLASALGEGVYAITATGSDDANNTSPISEPVYVTVDTTSPTILGKEPDDGETGVLVESFVNATFSEAMDPATINSIFLPLT